MNSKQFRFRLKFRMVTGLAIPKCDTSFDVPPLLMGAKISANQPRVPGVDQWITVESPPYHSEETAKATAHRLKDAMLIACGDGMGVDLGLDRVTSQLAESVKAAVKEKSRAIVRDEIHGVDVYEDGPIQHFGFGANGQCSHLA